ncbi:hypothetical protein TI39_contig4331g00002 [Zymoseptoria brevis]|uniref:Myb-like domain-containing protein n=1 Tax=Zymoseptoria brevis TaxID=1047168 RepID=A0A0F4G8K0_9PEZI|nr:hypothetical protein TI39_contig4331g00002 [Zymoseptoria brevis]
MPLPSLTDRELGLLYVVIGEMNATIDWNVVGPKANFTTPKQARDKWAVIKKKLSTSENGDDTTAGAAAATPKSSAKKTGPKRKAATEGTPSKKAKQSKTTVAAEDSGVGDEDDEEAGKVLIKAEQQDQDQAEVEGDVLLT